MSDKFLEESQNFLEGQILSSAVNLLLEYLGVNLTAFQELLLFLTLYILFFKGGKGSR
ncbi:hypothetical protein [Streptococcus suis]|uniref:hypothetical protein n=1 Tax=Streptococcus suis TaxID=1307 RepID=UPI0015D4B2C2|nr:hypothetical protein [Streptococcus suis]